MSILRIALLQISPCGGTEANLVKGLECCRKAKEMGADIALFPEMWSNGYGRAEKKQVQEMTRIMLNLEKIPKPDDAADALAMAICHCHSAGSLIGRLSR